MDELNFSKIEGLELTPVVVHGFEEDGIVTPTPAQYAAIAPILAGRDAVIQSGTGTGKTLAYLLPILQRLKSDPKARAIIFAPAAELAMQTLRTADLYKDPSIVTASLVSSGSIERQKEKLKKHPRLIVGTPGRILEFFALRKLRGVTIMVLDEPDPILSDKVDEYLREILSRPEPYVQLVVTAATIGPRAQKLVDDNMEPDYVPVKIDASPLHTNISHYFMSISVGGAKDVRLAHFIQSENVRRAIIFANQDNVLRHLYRYLAEHKLLPVTLSHERSKRDRQEAVALFTSGEARVLITSDVMARGLDVPDVSWVFHYELPRSAEAYLHRAGRTGRAGKSGCSLALVTDKERTTLKRFAQDLKLTIEPYRRIARG